MWRNVFHQIRILGAHAAVIIKQIFHLGGMEEIYEFFYQIQPLAVDKRTQIAQYFRVKRIGSPVLIYSANLLQGDFYSAVIFSCHFFFS